jgi:putative oxidoreductase
MSSVLDRSPAATPTSPRSAALAAWAPYALAILRIVIAYLFIQHGTAKFFGYPPTPNSGNVQLFTLVGLAAFLEIAGSLLLAIGFLTRPVAFVLCGFMAVAYFMAHGSQGYVLAPILNRGELAVVYCFVFLYFVFAGPGAWSVDGAIARSRGASRPPR